MRKHYALGGARGPRSKDERTHYIGIYLGVDESAVLLFTIRT